MGTISDEEEDDDDDEVEDDDDDDEDDEEDGACRLDMLYIYIYTSIHHTKQHTTMLNRAIMGKIIPTLPCTSSPPSPCWTQTSTSSSSC